MVADQVLPAESAEPEEDLLSGLRSERRDAAEHRRQILTAAEELFAAQGVESVQMQQIARAAGVGQGTLYRRYANKGELCMDLLRETASTFCHDLQACIGGEPDAGTAMHRLDLLLHRIVTFVEENRTYLNVVRDTCPGKQVFHRPLYRRMNDALVTLLAQAVDQGEIAPLDCTLTADMVQAALGPDLFHFEREEHSRTPEQIYQAVRHVYIEGLSRATRPTG